MKSERQQNQESDLIADKIENFLVGVRKSLPQILSIVGVVLVGLLAWGIYTTMHNSKMARAWTALYFSDTTASDLTSIAEDFRGTDAELWARQMAGDSHLAKGVESMFTNREVSEKHCQNAVEEYQRVTSKVTDGLLASRSHWGLAQAQEGLGKRDDASATYKKMSRLTNIEPALLAEAVKRATWLESSEGEAFFKWFQENRAIAPEAPAGLPSVRPTLPTSPTIELPGAESKASSEGETKSVDPGLEIKLDDTSSSPSGSTSEKK